MSAAIPCSRRRAAPRGFALVATMGMLILLMVVAVGLLGLSSIALRTSTRSEASARAQANARLALALAIGELQKHAGADTRVTARADILDETHPPVMGVWKSWEGSNHETSGQFMGRPVSPGDYAAAKSERFLAWLISANSAGAEPPATRRGSGTVALLGENSVGSGPGREDLQIHLEPTMIDQGPRSGGLAWWIGGENQKARLPEIREPPQDTAARWSVHNQSHSAADPGPFGLDELFERPELTSVAISLRQSDMIGSNDSNPRGSQEFFHDLSTTSVGLLTNTATGGWRKDLSLVTENWSQPGIGNPLPFFRVAPDRDIMYSKPTSSNPTAPRSMFYPWAAYRGGGSDPPIYRHGPVASWENLKDYATAYQRITGTGSTSRMALASVPIDGNSFDFLHKARILPVIARVQWVYSHSAGVSGSQLQPRLLLSPVITLWNPYSVELPIEPLEFNIPKPLPTALRYTINGVPTPYRSLTSGSVNYGSMSSQTELRYSIGSTAALKPGETRVFSHQAAPADANGGARLPLTPGYAPGGGHFFTIQASVPANASIQVEVALDTAYDDRAVGVGVYLDMIRRGARDLVYRMVYTPEVAREVYGTIDNLGGITAGELQSTRSNPRPFLTTIFGARMASNTHLSAKGFVQSSPLVNYTAMGRKDEMESTIARRYGGTRHPVNSPFDYSFQALSAAGSDYLPNVGDGNSGYIVTGFTSGTGVSRCVAAGIPVRPIASLAELQHWDIRYENPIPPYAFNIIGNSDASPLLPSDAVVNANDRNLNVNLQYDDSYCANHLLFDDWFVSSIAPNPNVFGSAGQNIQNTYTAFIQGETPLANAAYRPIAEDAAAPNPQSLYVKNIAPATSWRRIASRLEVDGMFNVNSTSVTAWRALLGHARNQKIPYIQASSNSWQVSLSETTDFAVSRTAIAGDTSATDASFGDMNAEIGGYRVFDEEILDRLAEEMVNQVRLRGPFLSLAEFVNRQLSTGELALAGAVQTALNQLAEDANLNPFEAVEDASSPSLAQPPGHPNQEYKFPEAAVGYGAYGVPAWTRQADLLRPIAPILSARDDTFTIRAYGDARDANGRILSRATCEAVVRRTRDFVDAADEADTFTSLKSEINQAFGRRLRLVSFRWLNDSEI